MKCGDFRRKAKNRVTIQKMNNTADDYGGEAVTWETQTSVWAIIEPMSGREIYAQDMNQSQVRHKVIIRYQSALKDTAITGSYRIVYENRVFPVLYVRNMDESLKLEGKRFQVFACEENRAIEQ